MASKTSATLLEGDALWIAYRKQMDAVLEKAKQEHRHCIVWSKDNVPMEVVLESGRTTRDARRNAQFSIFATHAHDVYFFHRQTDITRNG